MFKGLLLILAQSAQGDCFVKSVVANNTVNLQALKQQIEAEFADDGSVKSGVFKALIAAIGDPQFFGKLRNKLKEDDFLVVYFAES